MPLVTPIRLPDKASAIYDVFAGKQVSAAAGVIEADLRSLPARIYVLLPAGISSVEMRGPKFARAAQPFLWSVRVLDNRAAAIPTSIPFRLRLLGADGNVIEERFASATQQGASGQFVAPLGGAGQANCALEATELFSGKTAALKLTIESADTPKISEQAAPPPAAQHAAATEKASGRQAAPTWSPAENTFGPHIRDLAVAEDGKSILLNAMNWDENLYCVDKARGDIRWSKHVGHYFAFAPQPIAGGFAVQGFDFKAAEGYFLHLLDRNGKAQRRFALYGVPKRLPHRFVPSILKDRINNFTETKPIIKFVPSGGWGGWAQFVQDPKLLDDGQVGPPPGPWLNWANVGFFAETSPINYVLIDSFRTLMRVTAVMLVEDAAHPESFLRDASLDYWDTAAEQWVPVMPMLSNEAVHTHKLPKPVEAARWRIMLPWGVCRNLRVGDIVFHGEVLGCSHPDVVAKRPLVVLFDEGADLTDSLMHSQNGLSFDLKNAYTGNRSLVLNRPRDRQSAAVAPLYRDRFGHTIPNWDFEIAENPQPGQYGHVQFAWRGTAETKSIALRRTGSANETVDLCAGQAPANATSNTRKVVEEVPTDWQMVKVDLWEAFRKKAVRIQGMSLMCSGGSAWFDQIVLGQSVADVPVRQ